MDSIEAVLQERVKNMTFARAREVVKIAAKIVGDHDHLSAEIELNIIADWLEKQEQSQKQAEKAEDEKWFLFTSGKIVYEFFSLGQALEDLRMRTLDERETLPLIAIDKLSEQPDFYSYTAPDNEGFFSQSGQVFYLGTRQGFTVHFPAEMQDWDYQQEEEALKEEALSRCDQPRYKNDARVTFIKAHVAYPSVIARYLGRKPGLGRCYEVRAERPEDTGDWLVIKGERFLFETE